MTKAERIYRETRYNCKTYLETWGYKTNPDGTAIGYNSVFAREDECVYPRTLTNMETILIHQRNTADRVFRAGIHDAERHEKEMQLLNMIESTIRNNREVLARLGEI